MPNWLANKSDVVVGLVLVAFGVIASYLALQISPGPSMRTLPPNVVPLICTVGIGLCGAALVAKGLISKTGSRLTGPMDWQQAIVLVLFVLFFLNFEHIDYRLSIGIFIFAVMLVLGCRSIFQLVLVPVGTVVAIWIVFQSLFNVFLPTWI